MRKPGFVSCPTRECLFGLVCGNSNNGGVKCQQKNPYDICPTDHDAICDSLAAPPIEPICPRIIKFMSTMLSGIGLRSVLSPPFFLGCSGQVSAICRLRKSKADRTGVQCQRSQLQEGTCDNTPECCSHEFRRNRGCGIGHGHLHVWPNQIRSGRPGCAQRPGGCRHSAEGPYSERNCVLP